MGSTPGTLPNILTIKNKNTMRKKLIKWLGGYSAEEMAKTTKNVSAGSYLHALIAVKLRMQSCSGMEASEWCDTMWKYVINECKKLEQ